jgi:hypothetical protein
MARSSQPRSGRAAPATQLPRAHRRGAARDEGGQTAAPTMRSDSPRPEEGRSTAPTRLRAKVPTPARRPALPESSPTVAPRPVGAPVSAERAPAPLAPVAPAAPEASEARRETAVSATSGAVAAGEAVAPAPARTAGQPDPTAMFRAGRILVDGSVRVRSQMIGFGYRQAEHGLAFGRAMLAGGSLPEVLALQARYLGGAVDDALAQTLELSRLSTDVVCAGLESLRPR